MQPIKLGVIGTGMAWERLHYKALEKLKEQYEIVALCDIDFNTVQKAAQKISLDMSHVYEDYKVLLEKETLDAVLVAVPIPLNFQIAKEVILKGIPLIAEKPLAPNMQEAKKFYEMAKNTKVKIMIGENYRYNEEHAKIKYLIEEKKIGDVVFFIKNNVFDFREEMKKDTFAAKEWRQHPDFEGGLFLDAALHDLAGIMHLFGKAKKVQAFGKKSSEEFIPYVSVNVHMEFENNEIGYFVYWPTGKEEQKPPLGFRIYGTKGMIYLEEKGCGSINIFLNDETHEIISYEPEKGFYNEFLNFYNALRDKETIYVTPTLEYEDVNLVFKALESIEKENIIVP